ncbi:hypothetical protein KIH79_06830 [Bifidobacterium sp. 82T10]|uniref:Uncharacterized protein n=1 Tax=Bifidobacterium miconis TaxID=2834435 RepID=A0ABS6WG03_9BIFI|nr:hypothetical protein [Bifidobacterium miconis]MBW3092665.1 hypothetical protein [Bifidobacterium miconis]
MSTKTELSIQSHTSNDQDAGLRLNLTPDDPINGRKLMCWPNTTNPFPIDWDDAELLWRWLGLTLNKPIPENEQ